MKSYLLYLLAMLSMVSAGAQELYVFSEPASNMPAHSISAKLSTRVAGTNQADKRWLRFSPELMFGLSKDWMLHTAVTFSNFYSQGQRLESGRLYAKYRFYSNDDVHQHFRMAAFAEGSWSNSPFVFGDVNLEGDNSGAQAGIVATQLVHKLAVSGTASYLRVFADDAHLHHSRNVFAYTLSAGHLIFPLNYTGYDQTNLNVYVEAIGMRGLDKGDGMLDLAPALQLIFNSNFKINAGARFQVAGNMDRLARNNYFLAVERTFLGALKKRKRTALQ